MSDRELIYVTDAMCSWCWGFAPVIERLEAEVDLPIRLVVGGLRPGPQAQTVDAALAAFLGEHWDHVAEASGQPFDRALLERRGWEYDTEPAAIATVVLRSLAPERTLAFHHRLQEAFYARGVLITDPSTWPPLLDGWDVDRDAFAAGVASPEGKKAAWTDFTQARRWGIHGFPSLLVRDGDAASIVTKGWAPPVAVVGAVSRWLEERLALEGEACALDGSC